MSKVECSSCKKQFANTFPRCVFCNALNEAAPTPPPPGSPSPSVQAADEALRQAKAEAAQARALASAQARVQQVVVERMVAKEVKKQTQEARPARLAKRLIKAGVICLVFGGLAFSCERALSKKVDRVSPDDLVSRGHVGWVAIAGSADMSEATTLDINEPVIVDSADELLTRREDWFGRSVQLQAQCANALVWKTTWTDEQGRRTEDTHSRIYCPVYGTANRLWVLSEVITVEDQDQRVLDFASRNTYDGVFRRLSQLTSVKKLREAPTAPGTVLDRDIPDDAVAVVSTTGERPEKLMHYAPIDETDGDIWFVTQTEDLLDESSYYGHYSPCPSEECNKIPWPEDTQPKGMVRLSTSKAPDDGFLSASVLWLFIGIMLIGAGLTTKKWYPASAS